MRRPRTLTIVSSAPHHVWEGRLWSHAPYVREIDLWCHLFERVIIVGPAEATAPTRDCVPFCDHGLELRPVPPTGGDGLGPKERYPNFVQIAKGYGCGAAHISKKADLVAGLKEMIAYPGPYVLDVQVPYQEHVLPMIPTGMTVRDIIKE